MELIEALRSTGAVRAFEATPVPDDVVARLLDSARFAPNGGNRQAWHVVVVKNQATRVALRESYLTGWYEYLAQVQAGLTPWAAVTDLDKERSALQAAPDLARAMEGKPGGFAEHLDEAPVLLVLLADLRRLATVDRDATHYPLAGGASVYPFVWSLLLAARAEDLAGVMTTMALRDEDSVRRLLGAPDELVVAAVVALGRPLHQPTRLTRAPITSFATVDRVDGPAFGAT